jgi:hypothetical protein
VRRAVAGAIGVALIVGVVLVVLDLAHSNNHHLSASATTTTPRTSGRHGARPIRKSVTTTTMSNPVTIAAVGDTELGNTPNLPSDPSTYLQPVEAALSAPIVFGNLEGTLTDQSSSKCAPGATNCYAFHTPPSYAQVFRQAGFTVLNSANNHSHDFGSSGLSDTTAALQAAGITQTGLPGQIGVVTEGTTKVAFAAFAPYSNVNNLLDLTAAKQLIQQARAEASVVVVYMHAGAEGSSADHVTGQDETYVGEDRGNEKAFAHAAIDDGADLVIASGPHVLRGMEFYNGHLIAYSLGDFATYQDFSTSGNLDLSGILKVTLRPDGGFASGQFVSLLLDAEGRPAVDSSGSAAQFVNQLSTGDFASAAAIISASGQISPAPGSG